MTVVRLFLLIAALSSAAGCSQRVTLESWQTNLQRYAIQEHHGDLSFLRDPPPGSAHRQFTVMSSDRRDDSTDVTGVLVGRSVAGNQPWLIFIVGLIEREELNDMRLALLADDGSASTWRFGPEDPAAFAAYRSAKQRAVQARNPSRGESSEVPIAFPGADDVYRVQISGPVVIVTEQRSGAQWELGAAARRQR